MSQLYRVFQNYNWVFKMCFNIVVSVSQRWSFYLTLHAVYYVYSIWYIFTIKVLSLNKSSTKISVTAKFAPIFIYGWLLFSRLCVISLYKVSQNLPYRGTIESSDFFSEPIITGLHSFLTKIGPKHFVAEKIPSWELEIERRSRIFRSVIRK